MHRFRMGSDVSPNKILALVRQISPGNFVPIDSAQILIWKIVKFSNTQWVI